MLRVMMLSTDLQRGGLPMRFVALARAFREVDIEPIVGCLAERGPLNGELESLGIETFSCDARGRFDGTCLLRLAGYVRRYAPDVVHSALFHANLAARLVSRLGPRRPLITSTVTIEIERRWHRWFEAMTGCLSDYHVVNSSAVERHVCEELGFPPSRVVTIPNAVDLDAISHASEIILDKQEIPDDVPLVVWAGRMDLVKDLATFVDVMAAVADVVGKRRVAAVILGEGPERSHIERRIESLDLADTVRLVGWSGNVAGWMRRADVLLFPSLTEGSPNVVIEAMANGCCVVASDIPACRDLIEDGVHGKLCPTGGVEEFTSAILALLGDDSMRNRISDAARKRVADRHNISNITGQWHSLYHMAVEGR